jgi:hypothetical protein
MNWHLVMFVKEQADRSAGLHQTHILPILMLLCLILSNLSI